MDNYNFRGTDLEYGKYLTTDQLEGNLYAWLSWSLLGVGAFENITKGQSGVYGGDRSKLKPVNDPRYGTNKVWQAHRGDWCWESGTAFTGDPIKVSGVWVNNSFYPTTGATNAHYIDYPNGRVVFSSAIPATSTVQVEYSPRRFSIRRSDEPFFKQIMNGTYRVDDPQFTGSNPSGQWTFLPENRVALPVLVIEPTLLAKTQPYEMGNTSRIYKEDFLIHAITENPYDRNFISNILRNQNDKRIIAFNRNTAVMPLNAYGTPSPSAMTYPQLCQNYPFQQITIADCFTTVEQPVGDRLWWSTTRMTLEFDLG